MQASEAETWVTDCPLAAIQFEQHAGQRPIHPMSLLAKAYRSRAERDKDGVVTEPEAERNVAE